MFDEANYHPFSTSVLTGQKALVLSPHQDDESLACGGSLALHAINGDQIKIVFLTDGVLADTKSEYSPDVYAALRRDEALKAGTILGVTDIEFWNAPDRGLAQADAVLPRLCKLLDEFRPQLVYAPSPLEFHPDHQATARLIWHALQRTGHLCTVAFYDYNRPININTLVDISDVVEKKRQACDVYQSQLKYYPYTECAISLNRYRALVVSPACKYAEAFFTLDSREIWSPPIESFAINQFLPKRMKGDASLVSVIIRTHNRHLLLRQAISSVVAQTYRNIEIIVVNDGGEDIDHVLSDFRGYIPITQVRHEKSLGRAAAANAGMRAAKGMYINFLDDDDVLYSGHVEKLVAFLDKSGEQIAYSDCELCDYRWNGEGWIATSEKRAFCGMQFDKTRLLTSNYIAIMCAMFRKELFDRVGSFDESLEWLEDWDMWIRMSRVAGFHPLPGITAEYRRLSEPEYGKNSWIKQIHEKHGTSSRPKTLADRRSQKRSLERIYRLPELPAASSEFADLPKLRGYLDEVSAVAPGSVHITGWTYSVDLPIHEIEVHYKGKQLQRQKLSERADVGALATWLPDASKSGFGFTLALGDVESSGGAGLLEIVGFSEDGRRAGYLAHMLRGDVDRFPTPPEDYQHRVAQTRNTHFYQIAAVRSFGDIIQLLNRHVDWHKIENVFDWGCGSGRLSAQFLSAAPSISLTGADIDSRAIKWCRTNLPDGRFHVLSSMPPTDYEDGEFDLIVAFSVLTHLRSEVQEAWLREMYRVLKPGGWFVATTHGQTAFQFATQNLAPEWPASEFYDVADPALDGVAPVDYYRGTYQSEKYTRREFGKLFEIVEYVHRGANGFQDLVLMRKPE